MSSKCDYETSGWKLEILKGFWVLDGFSTCFMFQRFRSFVNCGGYKHKYLIKFIQNTCFRVYIKGINQLRLENISSILLI